MDCLRQTLTQPTERAKQTQKETHVDTSAFVVPCACAPLQVAGICARQSTSETVSPQKRASPSASPPPPRSSKAPATPPTAATHLAPVSGPPGYAPAPDKR